MSDIPLLPSPLVIKRPIYSDLATTHGATKAKIKQADR